MSYRVCARRMVLSVGLAVAVMLTGCAAIQRSEAHSTEQLLAAAGFVMRPADTAERQERLKALPPYQLESRTKDGKVVYTYADPGGCNDSTWADRKSTRNISGCGCKVRSPRMRRGRPKRHRWTGAGGGPSW
jgi:hypothetical protein